MSVVETLTFYGICLEVQDEPELFTLSAHIKQLVYYMRGAL